MTAYGPHSVVRKANMGVTNELVRSRRTSTMTVAEANFASAPKRARRLDRRPNELVTVRGK